MDQLTSRHLYAAPAPAVRADPARQARAALAYLGRRAGTYLVHFDVDVLHTGLFRWPTYRTSPGSPWTRRARAWTSSPAGRGSAGW